MPLTVEASWSVALLPAVNTVSAAKVAAPLYVCAPVPVRTEGFAVELFATLKSTASPIVTNPVTLTPAGWTPPRALRLNWVEPPASVVRLVRAVVPPT